MDSVEYTTFRYGTVEVENRLIVAKRSVFYFVHIILVLPECSRNKEIR